MRPSRWAAAGLTLALVVGACGDSDSGVAEDDPPATDAATDEGPVGDPPSDADATAIGPTESDHWHSAYGVYVCDGFLAPFENPNDPEGIHSHADGIIHIHPFSDRATGANATVGLFFDALGIELTDDAITAVAADARIEEGDDCDGSPTVLQLARWPIDSLDGEPELFTEGLADVVFEQDLDSYTLAFVPDGAEIPLPPTIPSLTALTDVAPEDLPELPDLPEAAPAVPRADPPEPGAVSAGDTECPGPDSERTTQFAGPPPTCLEPGRDYVAVFDTSEGVVRVELDTENTPDTANNFAVLARYGYYDDTALFRTDPSIDIIQGGAPSTNSPSDPGPGYTIADEGTGFTYQPGDLVMARTAAPDSASAQFFFSAGPDTSLLDSQGTYVVFGRVVDGLDVLEQILDLHVDDPTSPLGGGPGRVVLVNSVTIEER